jgi:kynurenine formamidase
MTANTRFVDLSHAVEHGVVTYKGLPAPVICDFMSRESSRSHYAPGTEFLIGKIEMVGNTGTYVDAPFHRFAHGADLAQVPLESLAELPAVVVDLPSGVRALDADRIDGLDVRGRAVLIRTGWSRHYGKESYFEGHPFLSREAARVLVERGATLVGIDSLNIDDTADLERPAHTLLLGAGIPIAEHLTGLDALPATGFRFSAVPARVRAFGTFPVRAYARIDES